MIIDKEIVGNIAELALLDIPEGENAAYIQSLTQILDLVEEMQSVDTQNIEPMSNPLDGVQTLRKDRVTEKNQREQFQKNAPQTAEGFYLVPRVIE